MRRGRGLGDTPGCGVRNDTLGLLFFLVALLATVAMGRYYVLGVLQRDRVASRSAAVGFLVFGAAGAGSVGGQLRAGGATEGSGGLPLGGCGLPRLRRGGGVVPCWGPYVSVHKEPGDLESAFSGSPETLFTPVQTTQAGAAPTLAVSAALVADLVSLSEPSRLRAGTTMPWPFFMPSTHRSAWKGNYRNFGFRGFSKVGTGL